MGDTSDYVYNAFFNTMQSSDAAHYINAINAMDTNNLTIAQRELNLIADTNAINHNRIIVGNIYSTTWALGNYQLTDDQVRTLTDIAYSDPYTNGDGVYTARVMLNIDPDDSNLVYRMALQLPKQVVKSNSVHVYPNPANDMLYIEFDNMGDCIAKIEFYDLTGKLYYSTSINTDLKLQTLNINSIKAGIYNLRISTTAKVKNQKLVIIK